MFTGVRVTRGDILGAGILIGMDIINRGDFSVTNRDGITKFSFRTPSIEHIDYVEQHKKLFGDQGRPPSRAERRRVKKAQR